MKKAGKVSFGIASIGAGLGFVSQLMHNYILFLIAIGVFVLGSIGVLIFGKEFRKWLLELMDFF